MPKVPTNAMVYIGVDPGKDGGISWIVSTIPRTVVVNKTPETERDIWEMIRDAGGIHKSLPRVAVVEKCTGFIKGVPTPGSYMFNFGENYGWLRMALVAAGISLVERNTNVWMQGLQIPKIQDEKRDDRKRRFRAECQKRFPEVPNHIIQTSDSLLIAEYCRVLTLGSIICRK